MKLKQRINQNYEQLNSSDLHILTYIMSNQENIIHMRIEDIAQKTNVSRTTILRLCKKIGFSGYSEFKAFLKWENTFEVTMPDTRFDTFKASVNETVKLLAEKDIVDICRIMFETKRIFIYGTGRAQQIAAEELKRMFLFHKKHLHLIQGERELEVSTADFTKEDCIIVISHTGSSTFLKERLQYLQLKEIKLISITTMDQNYLASISDYRLYGSSARYPLYGKKQYSSSLFYYIILEFLFIRYAEFYGGNKI